MILTQEKRFDKFCKDFNKKPSDLNNEQLKNLVQFFTQKVDKIRHELESREDYKSNPKLSGRASMTLEASIFLLLSAALVGIGVTFAPPLFLVLLVPFTLMVSAVISPITTPISTMLTQLFKFFDFIEVIKKKSQLSIAEDLLRESKTLQQFREQPITEQPKQVEQTVNNTSHYGPLFSPSKQVDLSTSPEQFISNRL